MRIGVVSDTHNNLKSVRRIVELFNDAGVSRVIHTGDITQAKTVAAFGGLTAPLYGVFGNNDQGELASLQAAVTDFGYHFVQPPLTLVWSGRRIVVVHDPLELDQVDESDFDLVLHGHTHRHTLLVDNNRMTFNPGECAGMMPGLNAVGVVDLQVFAAEVIRF